MVLAIAASFDPIEPSYSTTYRLPILGCPVRVIISGGRSFVPVASFCEALGLDLAAQRAALPGWGWADLSDLVRTDVTGTSHTDEVLPRNVIFFWLCTVDPEHVRPALRERLEAYQLEAAEVLGRGPSVL